MTTITFYEKPGCINNTKQKTLLQAAGHNVDAHNLLTEPWTREQLRRFFSDRPVAEWFNPTAPAIKSGQVKPSELDAETALTLMLQDPLLIRRPLMQVNDRYEVGFNPAIVDAWIGLKTAVQDDLETCPNTLTPNP
ncbi:MAG: ArsC/Spx/MgsR family protein [Prochlorotrichaceae cyanobacterium]|jgi:nitrogenase-associated protein